MADTKPSGMTPDTAPVDGTLVLWAQSADGLADYGVVIDDLPISDATQTALDAKLASATAATTYQPLAAVLTATTASFTTADETKLDGIEALADVTDATNVTAAGAVMYDADDDVTITTSSVVSGGVRTGATIRAAAGVEVSTSYTQTTSPAGDALVGSSFIATPTATLEDNTASVGAVFQSGNFGPDGVFAIGSGFVQYRTNNTRLGLGPLGFTDVLRVGNVAGEARTIVPAWGFMHARVWTADSATVTAQKTDIADGGAAFVDSQFFLSLDSGTWDGTTNDVDITSLMSTPMLLGNVHFNRRIGVDIQDINGSPSSLYGEGDWQTIFNGGPLDLLDAGGGDVVENIGVLVRDLTHGTTLNLGVWSVPPIVAEGGVYGGTASGEDLLLASTLNATRGDIQIRDYVHLITENKTNASTTPVTLIEVPATTTFSLADTAGGFNTGNALAAVRFSGTVVYEETSQIISSGQLFHSQPVLKNANGEARTIAQFWTFASQNGYQADGATVTHSGHVGFTDLPSFARINAGTLNADSVIGFRSACAVDTGATVTTRRGVHILDSTGTGAVTTGIGIDIDAMSDAATSIGIRNASSLAQSGVSTFTGTVTITDVNVVLGTTTGTKFGTATTQKLGFYNATPIVRPGAYTQTFSTADKTHAARTSTGLSMSVGTADGTIADVGAAFSQTTLNNNFRDVGTEINAVRADLADTAALLNSVIDDLQALGLVG